MKIVIVDMGLSISQRRLLVIFQSLVLTHNDIIPLEMEERVKGKVQDGERRRRERRYGDGWGTEKEKKLNGGVLRE